MEAAPMVMMPAMPQESGMQVLDETLPPQSGGLTGEQFASLLGEALAGGSRSDLPEIESPPAVTIETADPTVLLPSDAQQNAQLMTASYMQAAMMVPVMPVLAELPAVQDAGLPGVAEIEGLNAAAAAKVTDQLLSAQDMPQEDLMNLQNLQQSKLVNAEDEKGIAEFHAGQKLQENKAVDLTAKQSDAPVFTDEKNSLPTQAVMQHSGTAPDSQSAKLQNPKIATTGVPQEPQNQLHSENTTSVNELSPKPRNLTPATDVQQAAAEESAVIPEMTNLQKNVSSNQQLKFATQPGVELAAAETSQGRPDSGQSGQQQNMESSNSRMNVLVKDLQSTDAEFVESDKPFGIELQSHKQEMGMNGMHLNRQVASTESAGTATATAQSVSAEHISKQVSDKLSGFEVKQGNNQISLSLSPENLGNLQMNVRMEDQRIRVDIVAENRSVRDALLQQADELKETLARQNIKMDSFNVTTGSNGTMYQQSGDWRQTAAERQPKIASYGSPLKGSSAVASVEMQTRYFAPQYQSTLDVRF